MIKKHILVLGSGSVGKRHIKNFVSLGCEISAMDPRADRLEEATKESKLTNKFSSLNDALSSGQKFDAAVVASPPKFHIDQAIELLKAGIPVLLEKPLAKTLDEAKQLSRYLTSNLQLRTSNFPPLLLGYTYRWWPSLIELKKKILSEEIGKPLHASFIMSAHLADWHPWEKYQDFFMASKDLGGGALLDESHWLDLMIWFFGMPDKVFADIGKISDLEIDTDDNVDMLVYYKNGFRVSLHLDLYGRPHQKSITVFGERGSLNWSFETDLDRNIMFMNLAKDFLLMLDNNAKPQCVVEDGLSVLKIIEAARKSSASGRVIEI